jgi:hypothetical protein
MKKTVEQLLRAEVARPNRKLRPDFTQRVLKEIERPRKKRVWWDRYLQVPHVHLPKPIAALPLVVIILAVGSSTYAVVTNWPDTSAKLQKTVALPSGNRIVAVDTDNCLGFQSLDGTAKPDGKSTLYYEVRKESTLTNEQVVGMVQANCEENVSNNAFNGIYRERFGGQFKKGEGPNIMSGSGFVIQAIDAHSVTLGADPKWFADPGQSALQSGVRYTHLASNVAVYDRSKTISFKDLRVGDSVKVAVRDTRKLGSEVDPKDPNHWDEPDQIVFEIIMRVPKAPMPMSEFYAAIGSEFVRVAPCKESPSGFCRAYEFVNPDGKSFGTKTKQ